MTVTVSGNTGGHPGAGGRPGTYTVPAGTLCWRRTRRPRPCGAGSPSRTAASASWTRDSTGPSPSPPAPLCASPARSNPSTNLAGAGDAAERRHPRLSQGVGGGADSPASPFFRRSMSVSIHQPVSPSRTVPRSASSRGRTSGPRASNARAAGHGRQCPFRNILSHFSTVSRSGQPPHPAPTGTDRHHPL